jgi:hypothetical protein
MITGTRRARHVDRVVIDIDGTKRMRKIEGNNIVATAGRTTSD